MRIIQTKDMSVQSAAEEAARVLNGGGLVIYPTDTLYGLGASMNNPEAIALLHAVKARDESKFLSFIVPDIASIREYAVISDTARSLAERFLPGPLTLKLMAREHVPLSVAPDGAIRIRIPNDPVALAIAQAFGSPFSATSANVSGMPTLPTISEILDQFGDRANSIALAIDDGPRAGGVPSTIISCMEDEVVLIREGAISREMLGL